MAVRDLSLKDAEQLVREKDKEREAFINTYFKVDSTNFSEFDLAFNTSIINTDLICEMVKLLLRKKEFIH